MRAFWSDGIQKFGLCACLMFGTFVTEAQTRNRSLVAWGENLLGLNRPPELPAGIAASDVEAVTAGELVSGLTPAAWGIGGTYELDVSSGGGRASFSVGTASLSSTPYGLCSQGQFRRLVHQLG